MTPEKPVRLDQELVRRGLARSRTQAAQYIAADVVRVGGRPAVKAAQPVASDDDIVVTEQEAYVSRAAHKLSGALRYFGTVTGEAGSVTGEAGTATSEAGTAAGSLVRGRRCLDAGASTGGFTQVLLEAGASEVVAVDVGHDQFAPELARRPDVTSLEGTNVRGIGPDDITGAVDIVVADLSFISLTLVLPALRRCVRDDGDLFLMVKPQFELKRSDLDGSGVVRDPAKHGQALRSVAATAGTLNLRAVAICRSELPGPSGNIEFFIWFKPLVPEAADRSSEPNPMLVIEEFASQLTSRQTQRRGQT
ncbi:TlyA family RNA methyltransferase [Saxibacter everestensis]|uniref:TlyA family RNA methyltransferase n=1 Tax=Saxibacter everestensis TaxID=2909229 RepID=A0ABY8QY32_9MICO|nr:TlyA family RNA methyltransferase [Brevibacteriaceae bacterium ZFBP1038]